MIRRILAFSLLIGICLAGLAGPNVRAKAKVGRTLATEAPTQRELPSLLPDSDAVVLVDVHKVLQDFLPHLLATRKDKMDEINAQIDKMKEKTGIDARMFQNIAVGFQFVPNQQKETTVKMVALARGDFKASAIIAAARIAANGKSREVKYKGKTITVIAVEDLKDQAAKVAGQTPTGGADKGTVNKVIGRIINDQAGELAVYAVDDNTLVFGDLARVQASIDVAKTPAGNAAVVALAQRVPDSIIGVGGKVPPDLSKLLEFENDAITKNLDAIRQGFGAVSYNTETYNLLMGARTTTPTAAVDLRDTLEGLQFLGGMAAGQIKDDAVRKIAKRGLDNLKVSQKDNEVQMQLAVPQDDAAVLLGLWK